MNSFALRKVNISALTRERGERDYGGGYYGSLGIREFLIKRNGRYGEGYYGSLGIREFLIKRNGRYGEGYYGSLGIREWNYLTKEWAQSLTLPSPKIEQQKTF
jgi:hypothetical protein